MKKTILSTIVLIALSMSCAKESNDNLNHQTKSSIMEKESKIQITNLLMAYRDVLNSSDAEKAVTLYTNDGVFMPSEGPSAIGSVKIKESYDFVFSQIQLNIEFFIEEIQVEKNMAFAITTSKGTTLIRAINQTVPEENRELFVFEKNNGEWKIARYMFNKISAPAQAME